jgi:hypothetical protein
MGIESVSFPTVRESRPILESGLLTEDLVPHTIMDVLRCLRIRQYGLEAIYDHNQLSATGIWVYDSAESLFESAQWRWIGSHAQASN